MKHNILSLVLISAIFAGCNSTDDSSDSSTGLSFDNLSAQSYSLYQKSIDEEADRYINTLLSKYKAQFLQQISDAAKTSGYTLSDEETNFVLDSLVFDFKHYLKQDILKDINKNLKKKYEDTLNELNLKESEEVVLSDFEKNLIREIALNYFDEQPVLDEEIDSIAKESSDKYLKPSQTQSKSARAATSTASPQLSSAKDTVKFNKLMNSLFGSYKPEKGNNVGGGIDGGAIHGDNRVTNELKENTLYINEPSYDNGELKIKESTKDVTFQGKRELSTSADLNGDGFESLVVESCDNGTLYFQEISSKVDNYATKTLFKLENQKCGTTTDFVSGDFDGDSKDELALGTNSGVFIYDDADHGFAQITNFKKDTGYSSDNVYRLASGNVADKTYDDLGVVVYNSDEDSTFKAMAYLFEMSGMKYLEDNNVSYDYTLYTLNEQELDYTTAADVAIGDFELYAKLKMYVLQMSDKQEHETYGPDKWKERHDASGIGIALDNHWCTYRAYYKNHMALYSVDNFPIDPTSSSPEGMFKVGESDITNRISSTYVKPAFGCDDKSDINILKDGSHGILFSKNNPIQLTAYKRNTAKKGELSILDLNGVPLSAQVFSAGNDYEISGLYDKKYYSPGSPDLKRPNLSDDNYEYEYKNFDTFGYNYVNTYVESPKHDSYFNQHSDQDIPSDEYGNRGDDSLYNQRFVFSKGDDKQKVISHPTYYNDSLVMLYRAHTIFYSDPQTVVYMSAPPVKAGQVTSFTYSTGECSTTQIKESSSNGFTAGAGVLFGALLGGSALGATATIETLTGVSIQAGWSKDSSNFDSSSTCSKINSTIKSDYSNDKHLISNDIVKVKSSIADTYTYEIIKDLNHPENVGKNLHVSVTRKDNDNKKIEYSKWMNIPEYTKVLNDYNKSLDVNFSSIVKHKSGEIGSYLTLDEYNTLERSKHNSVDSDVIYHNFYRTKACTVQQDEHSNVDSYEYSLTSVNGTTKGDTDTQTVLIQNLTIFRAGFLFAASGRTMLNYGWTHKHTITYSSSTSNSASYKFAASGATTQEPTNDSYMYGAFTYDVSKKGSDGKAVGKPIKVIDFYTNN